MPRNALQITHGPDSLTRGVSIAALRQCAHSANNRCPLMKHFYHEARYALTYRSASRKYFVIE